jgi:YhcH/YjgK/YiaL family protein
MILDSLENSELYWNVNSHFKKAFEFLREKGYEGKAPGRYDLDDKVYYMVQENQTRPQEGTFPEAHRKYIDIQYLISGDDLEGCTPLAGAKEKEAYDGQKDAAFYEGIGNTFILSPGCFAVYFPTDAHTPNLSIGKPGKNKKIVMKVPV